MNEQVKNVFESSPRGIHINVTRNTTYSRKATNIELNVLKNTTIESLWV